MIFVPSKMKFLLILEFFLVFLFESSFAKIVSIHHRITTHTLFLVDRIFGLCLDHRKSYYRYGLDMCMYLFLFGKKKVRFSLKAISLWRIKEIRFTKSDLKLAITDQPNESLVRIFHICNNKINRKFSHSNKKHIHKNHNHIGTPVAVKKRE